MKLILAFTLLAVCAVHAAPLQARILFFDDFNNLIHDVVNTLGNGIDQAVQTVGAVVSNVGNVLGVGDVTNALTGIVNNVVDKTTDAVGGAVNQIVDAVKSTADGATLGIGSKLMSMANLG
ncbi:uncharacterized protein LOC129923688 [Biomphalaria glabrata]|uniref:Uncharacterized protein LOC129923688 n=1 Tax=Biomphalaria glabrata TaxID=6526 RepID=A0A9W2ZAN5_BIOGL|nr:uncharacterized protein LOC129923688 [Biomphalaria glabrata]